MNAAINRGQLQKSIGTKLASILLMAVIGATLSIGTIALNPQEAYAKQNKTTVYKAYKKTLRSICIENNGGLTYYFKDINKDKVVDMVVFAGSEAAGTQLYTYKSGRVKKLTTVNHGAYSKYYKKSKTLYASTGHQGVERNIYYKWTGAKVQIKAERITVTQPNVNNGTPQVTYKVNGSQCSKAKYNKRVRKLTKGKSFSAKKSMRAYKPCASAANAKNFMKSWAKAKISPAVDRIDCENYDSARGYWMHGVWSYPSHDATAFWCYVSKTGRISNYTGV